MLEEARLIGSAELAKSLEDAEKARAQAFLERLAEAEKALAARKRALETSLSERAAALDIREDRLAREAARLDEHKRGPESGGPRLPSV